MTVPPPEEPETIGDRSARRERDEREWLHLPISRVLILAASLVVILGGLLGTIGYNSFKGAQNSHHDRLQQQEISDILSYLNGTRQTAAQTAANQWVVKQIRDICLAFQKRPTGGPPCKLEPLPPLLRQFLNQPPPRPATPPTTRAP